MWGAGAWVMASLLRREASPGRGAGPRRGAGWVVRTREGSEVGRALPRAVGEGPEPQPFQALEGGAAVTSPAPPPPCQVEAVLSVSWWGLSGSPGPQHAVPSQGPSPGHCLPQFLAATLQSPPARLTLAWGFHP